MSTTPMHRPFLVGQNPASHDVATQVVPDRDIVYRGLHLVPSIENKKNRFMCHVQNHYKVAAVAAALFLVLTIV
jgi:hypothetical protein